MIVFLDGWSVVDLEAVVRCTDGQRGRPLGHWWRLTGVHQTVQLYSAWAGLAVDVYSVQWVYTGTAEARRRLSGTSHIGQSRRRGDQSDVKMLGEREQWHLVNMIQTLHPKTREDALQRKLGAIFVRWFICGDLVDSRYYGFYALRAALRL